MKRRKVLAILMAAALLLSMLPTGALAATLYDTPTDTHCTSERMNYQHWWTQWTVTREASCDHTGSRTRTCNYCGYTQTETIGRKAHSWGSWRTTREATCTETGRRERTCRVCGEVDRETVSRLPHTWGEWEIVTEATDHSAGVRKHTCQVCGTEATEEYDPEGTLRRGDRGDEVRGLQQGLICYGALEEGGADGSFGRGTERAVQAVQEAEGFEADGVAWPQTQSVLGHRFGSWVILSEMGDFSMEVLERTCERCGYVEHVEIYPTPMYVRGDKGDGVKALQEGLNAAGYDVGRADGDFGGRTERGVKAIEEDHGVEADGKAWPGVLKWLGLIDDEGNPEENPEGPNISLRNLPMPTLPPDASGFGGQNLGLTVELVSSEQSAYELEDEVSFRWTVYNVSSKEIVLHYVSG